jgi:PAS domain-containing protein
MHAPISIEASRGETGQLEQSLALHEAALDSLSHGLFMLDAELRLVLYNSRYLEMYDLKPDEVRVGMSFVDILRLLARHGSISDEQINEHHRKRREMTAEVNRSPVRQMSDGRTYLLNSRPVAGGCWSRRWRTSPSASARNTTCESSSSASNRR